MGAEADCVAVVDGRRVRGKAKLETSTLEFRAAGTKFVARFNELTNVTASDGVLSATSGDRAIALTLGASASKWADKILHPPSRLQKLGVQPTWRAAIVGPADPQFATELKPTVAMVSEGRLPKRLVAFSSTHTAEKFVIPKRDRDNS